MPLKNKKIKNKILFWTTVSLIALSVACNPTKRIADGEYMLRAYKVNVVDGELAKEQLNPFIRQKPNRKIFGVRFHLWLYNSAKPEKTNRWNQWLRKSGEEPVIWQQSFTTHSSVQLNTYLTRKGYYYGQVTDSTIFKKKKATVIYTIKPDWGYIINNITYSISDTSIAKHIEASKRNSLIIKGNLFDQDVFRNESKRIETYLKNRGYFSFAEDFVEYAVDTLRRQRIVDVEVTIKPYTERTADNQVVVAAYPIYSIGSVKVNASLSMRNLVSQNRTTEMTDTLEQAGIKFIIPKGFPVNASTIGNAISIYPSSLYRISDVNRTYSNLNGLRNFQLVTQEFKEHDEQIGMPERQLDCVINLLPLTRQSYSWELEATNSDGNMGGTARLLYHNKSLFGNAEYFDLRLRSSIESVPTERLLSFRTKSEYEVEATLSIPKFILPIPTNLSDRFTQRYNPRTVISVAYNYQQYPEYFVRTVFSTSYGFSWRSSQTVSHIVKPIDIIYVQLPAEHLYPSFLERLEKFPYLRNSFRSHMAVSSNYTFVRDMRLSRRRNATYTRYHIETAGLLLNTVNRLIDPKNEKLPYSIFNNIFSQFIKTDADLRYYYTASNNNKIIFRTFFGLGIPYGNSRMTVTNEHGDVITVATMPYEKKYYSGGANSMRGWRLRSLGPGSYKDTVLFTLYPNNTGDIKLEANIEYQFKLLWKFEGAAFVDAGNVWDATRDRDRPGADFNFNRFYREIAFNTGVGLRMNLDFLIIRADLGLKMYDPAGAGYWTFTPKQNSKRRIGSEDLSLSIAIGYPFN
jgi:hypothetical protein